MLTAILHPRFALGLGLIFACLAATYAQPPDGRGRGPRGDADFAADREIFHFLLDHRQEITRKIKVLETGVETVTETGSAEVRDKLREHVSAMHKRLKDRRGIHLRDPLFADIFRHADKITMKIEQTEKGLKVTETSDDPYVAKLIKAHAEVVSKFLERGPLEVRENHPLPK